MYNDSCRIKEKIKENYPLQISRLEQSVIDTPLQERKDLYNLVLHVALSSLQIDLMSKFLPNVVVPISTVCSFPSAPPTNEQLRIIEDIAGKLPVQLEMPEDGFEVPIFKQFIHTISPPLSNYQLYIYFAMLLYLGLYQTAKSEIETSVKNLAICADCSRYLARPFAKKCYLCVTITPFF